MSRKEKVYLNTEKDVIDALQKGETVYEKDCKGEDKVKYYMYNGVIISQWFTDGCNKFINSGSLYVEKNRYFCYRKEPLKIEVGKFYKTRDRRKVICVYKEKIDKNFSQPNKCVIIGEGADFWVTEEGRFSKIKYDSGLDIVDYWEE